MGVDDTIAAIATAAGRGAIGVVRISGPATRSIAAAILGEVPPPRTARLKTFRDASGGPIDQGIALFFPAPASYTGEDMLELQGHGGPVVMALLLARCIELGARQAEPGEFTRRAYLNDKLDLAQAEAVADVIEAATARAARSAVRSLTGALSERVAALQQDLISVRVSFEASFDFPEEDVDVLSETGALEQLARLEERFTETLRAATQGSLLRDGVTVALSGAPNVGKSSLINKLARDEVAIVTPVPGTTRDLLRANIAIRGIPIQLVDTAGMRSTSDPVEMLGVERARRAAREADVVLAVTDAQAEPVETVPAEADGARAVFVHNKIDLAGLAPRTEVIEGAQHVWVSAKTGAGLELLEDAIVRAAGGEVTTEGAFTARQRHVHALERARQHVRQAREAAGTPEFAAEELRLAQEALSQITGEHVVDDLLGEIFARFCIGK